MYRLASIGLDLRLDLISLENCTVGFIGVPYEDFNELFSIGGRPICSYLVEPRH